MSKLYNPLAKKDEPLKAEAAISTNVTFQAVTVGGTNTIQIPALFDPQSRTCVPMPKKDA